MKNNLAKIYINYLCYINGLTLSRLSILLKHNSNWLSADVLKSNSSLRDSTRYRALTVIAKKLKDSPKLLAQLYNGNSTCFDKFLSRVHRQIHNRKELIGYIKLCLDLEDKSLTNLSRHFHHGNNYFRNGLKFTPKGKSYRELLTQLENGLNLNKGTLASYQGLPKIHHNRQNVIRRQRAYRFLSCYAQAIGTNFKVLYTNLGYVNLRAALLRYSEHTFQKLIKSISRAIPIPLITFQKIMRGNREPYQKIRKIALHHVHDRSSLIKAVKCLASCNGTNLEQIKRKYHYKHEYIAACLNKNYYQRIKQVLMQIRPTLAVNHEYIRRLLKRSRIPKSLGKNSAYDNLRAFIHCFCIKNHTSIKEISVLTFNNKDRLDLLINKDSRVTIHQLLKGLHLIGISPRCVTEILHGNDQPLAKITLEMYQRVQDRATLQDYFRCKVYCHHTNLIHLNHDLHRKNSYVTSVISYSYSQTVAKVFKQVAELWHTSPKVFLGALRKSKIRPATKLTRTTSYRKRPTLDRTSRKNIKNRLYQIIYSHHKLPSHLSMQIHPKVKYNSTLPSRLFYGSRDSIISEIALILNVLDEQPFIMKKTLYRNCMGSYYSLLKEKWQRLRS